MLMTFLNESFQNFVPNIFDNFSKEKTFKNYQIETLYWNTPGQEEYSRLR
jgi:GTPase SAR1 family protein